MINLKPLGSYVLLKLEEKRKESRGGIHLPDSVHTSDFVFAEVVEVGPGMLLSNGEYSSFNFTVGDTVGFFLPLGREIEVDGEKYQLVDGEKLAVVKY